MATPSPAGQNLLQQLFEDAQLNSTFQEEYGEFFQPYDPQREAFARRAETLTRRTSMQSGRESLADFMEQQRQGQGALVRGRRGYRTDTLRDRLQNRIAAQYDEAALRKEQIN